MTRRMTVRQPIDLALSLEMGQSFRWRRVGYEEVPPRDWGDPPAPWQKNGGAWYSGVMWDYLVHLRQTGEGLEYRVGGEDGERHDVDLDQRLHDYFRLDDDIVEIYGQLGQHHALASSIGRHPGLRLLRQEPWARRLEPLQPLGEPQRFGCRSEPAPDFLVTVLDGDAIAPNLTIAADAASVTEGGERRVHHHGGPRAVVEHPGAGERHRDGRVSYGDDADGGDPIERVDDSVGGLADEERRRG